MAAQSEAARKNLPVAAHRIGGQGLKRLYRRRVQVIEHMYMRTLQDAEWSANSKCIVDFTPVFSWIRRARKPCRQTMHTGFAKPAARPGKTEALMSTGVPYVLGNRMLTMVICTARLDMR